jgi:hypothetical protein
LKENWLIILLRQLKINLMDPVITDPGERQPPAEEHKFFPAGAIAFFILLVILSLLFWYGMYFLMIERT